MVEKPQLTAIKVVAVQILPSYKDVKKSMKKAEVLLEDLSDKDKVDILLLSEMVFSGYTFKDKEDIKPFAEKAGEGVTFEWCSAQAKRLGCWVFCGYPELVD